jgi:hypothetical protein
MQTREPGSLALTCAFAMSEGDSPLGGNSPTHANCRADGVATTPGSNPVNWQRPERFAPVVAITWG